MNGSGGTGGFYTPTIDVFRVKKDNGKGDYKENMNGEKMQEWMVKFIDGIPAGVEKVCLVIDRASYHLMRDPEKALPRTDAVKEELVDWCKKRNLPYTKMVEKKVKKNDELWEVIHEYYKDNEAKYLLQKMAEDAKDVCVCVWCELVFLCLYTCTCSVCVCVCV